MNARRTDLALEAHALFRAAQRDDAIDGLTFTERTRRGCAVTTVTVEGEAAARALGKPRGTYVTLDLLDEAGVDLPDPAALRGQGSVMVTPRDIDARAGQLARVVGFGVGLALQPSLSLDELRALID